MRGYLDALDRYTDAKKDLDKCVDSCYYDSSYFCHDYHNRVNEHRDSVEDELNKLIDSRIAVATGAVK